MSELQSQAAQARMFWERLAGEGGLLHQIETGGRQPDPGAELDNLIALVESLGQQAGLGRVLVDRMLRAEQSTSESQ